MSDFEDDVLNSDADLDYEVCEEDEEALLADDQSTRNNQVTDARERIMQRSISKSSKAEEDWDEEEEDDDNEGRGRFLSERAPNPQVARPREVIPDSLDQVEVPEAEVNNRRPQNFQTRGRGNRRGGRFFHRGGFRGRGRGGFPSNGNLRSLGDDGMRYHQDQPSMNNGPPSAPTKILINPHFKGPRPLLKTPTHFEPEEPFRQFPPPSNNPAPSGPGYQQYNNPPLLPPPQPYHEPPRAYPEQPPPYHPPQHRQPPPQDWVHAEPFYPGRPHHPDFSNSGRPPTHRPPLLQPPLQQQQQQPPYGGPPARGPYSGPQHRPPPPHQQYPPAYQQAPPPSHQLPPYAQPPPQHSYQQPPPPMNYPPPPAQPSYPMHSQPPHMGPQAPYYDQHNSMSAPPPMYTAPPPAPLLLPPVKDDFRPSIFLTERLDRRRSRSRSRSPYYDRYRRRSRSRSRSYSPPRRYRDDLRREKLPPRRISPEPLRKPVSRQHSPPPPLMRKRESTPPPRRASNPEEAAYLRAIEKQKQERETVLKMKAIKRKLEIEKKKRDGDKPEVASPEKVAPGPSKESPQKVSPVAEAQSTKILLKPKIKVIKKMEGQEPTRKISLVTSSPTVDEPLVSRALSKNGEDSAVRRIVASKKDIVSSVLRGAEGPSMDQSYSKKIIKKSVVITKPASQAGLSSTSEDRVSLVSANHQMRLAVTKTAKQVMASGIVVAIENIPSATTPDTLKKMGMGLGLKAIRMKKLGTHQTAQMVFSTREGAEKFVKQNQRKVLDLSVIDLKIL